MRRLLIGIEIAAIVGILVVIGMRATSVSPVFGILHAGDFKRDSQSIYRYYFEPAASTTLENKPSWAATSSINTINADTLNDRFNYSVQKSAGTFRIAVLGDSFAYGLYVNTATNFTELLEDALNKNARCAGVSKYEVINFGVPTYDLEYEVERYRLRAEKYRPDMVLWFMEAGDFSQVSELFQQDLENRLHEADPNLRFDFFHTSGTILTDAWQKARSDYQKQITPEDAQTRELASIQRFDTMFSGPLLVFSIPPAMRISPQTEAALREAFADRPHTSIKLDMASPWSANYQVLPDDAHPNQLGSEKLEQALYQYLQSQHLIPCAAGN